jgi:glucokinase
MIGIGVDIGGTFVKLYVMNDHGEIFRREKLETCYENGTKGFIAQIGNFINQIKEEFAEQRVCVAVGAPGDVDCENGILRYNPNLKFTDVKEWHLADQLEKYTSIRPYVVNDATLAAWGVYEKDLQRKGTNVLIITLGTGVGGGLIINKELYQGSHGTAGEIGHMKIADSQTGPLCGCGARGCLEAFVGTIGIKRRALQSMVDHPDSILARLLQNTTDFKVELVAKAAQEGCPQALKIWQDTGYYLGVGIANLTLILDIDTVILTGGVSGAAAYFMPTLKQVLDNQPFKTPFKKLTLGISKNPDIGGVGAAMYAIYRAQQDARK